MSEEILWDGLAKFANKLRARGYQAEMIRSDDEMFETYILTITRDKTDKGNYFG